MHLDELSAQARSGVSVEAHEAYFRQLLGDVDEPTAPFGLLNVHGDGTASDEARLEVEPALAGRVRAQARRLGVSATSLFHVAWAHVLARVSGRDDVVFGTVLFGQLEGGAGAERALGLFSNTLPVRVRVGHDDAQDSVRGVQKQLAELMHHQHAPLALAQRCSAVPAPTPLFAALLNYRHTPSRASRPETDRPHGLDGVYTLHTEERTNYPITLSVDDRGEAFTLTALAEPTAGPAALCAYI